MSPDEELRERLDDADIYLGTETTCSVPVRVLEGVLGQLRVQRGLVAAERAENWAASEYEARLVALIRDAEWAGHLQGYRSCPWCSTDPHASDCPAFGESGPARR